MWGFCGSPPNVATCSQRPRQGARTLRTVYR
nr:MAG TPA: hypothetical protein [Caudoviricetes sp.]